MGELETRLADSRHGIDLLASHIGGLPLQELLLGSLLKLVTDGLSQRFRAALRPHHLSESEFLTLIQLFIHGDAGISPAELGLLVDQTRANMTHITQALVGRGFITREPSARDQRSVELRVTPAGRSFVQALLPLAFQPIRTTFAGLSEDECHTLQDILQKVVRLMDAQPTSSPAAAAAPLDVPARNAAESDAGNSPAFPD